MGRRWRRRMAQFLVTAVAAAGQQVMHAVTFQGLDGHAGAVRQFLPARCGQFGLKLRQFVPPGGQQIAAVGFVEKAQGVGADHAAVHHPHPLTLAEPHSTAVTMRRTVCTSLVLPARVSWANGKPSRVTIKASTICRQSPR